MGGDTYDDNEERQTLYCGREERPSHLVVLEVVGLVHRLLYKRVNDVVAAHGLVLCSNVSDVPA